MRSPLAILLALGLFGCEADAPVDDGTPVVDDANDVRHPIRLEPRRDGIGLAGITLTSGVDPSTTIIAVKGGGLGLVDGDGDGDLDLLLPNGATLDRPFAGPGAVYLRNLAVEEGRLAFEDATEGSGFEGHRDWSFGVAVGDVDGDGIDDVIVATLGPDRVWLGRGDGTFEDATEAWGLADATGWTSSVGLGDAAVWVALRAHAAFSPKLVSAGGPHVARWWKYVESLDATAAIAQVNDDAPPPLPHPHHPPRVPHVSPCAASRSRRASSARRRTQATWRSTCPTPSTARWCRPSCSRWSRTTPSRRYVIAARRSTEMKSSACSDDL